MSTELILSPSQDTAGIFDNGNENVLTTDERRMLINMLGQNERVDLVFPDGMAPVDLWRKFDICARVYSVNRRLSGVLKSFIGRALCVIQDTPEIYESRGFTSFNDFMSDESRGLPKITGICRAELFKAKSVAKSFGPNMDLNDAAEIGFTKMRMVASVSKAGDSTFRQLTEAAKTDTIPQLSERIARMGLAESGELEYDIIQFSVTKAQKQFINQFLTNPQVRAYCETEHPGAILERMVQEVTSEWEIRGLASQGIQ